MPIVGFNYTKILVEKKKPIRENIKVKNDMSISNIKKAEIAIAKQEGVLQVDFTYSADYQPNIAYLEIQGNLLFLDTPEETNKTLETWKKNKKLPSSIARQILNAILIKCSVKALSLSQDLNLPPHIRLPTISPRAAPKLKKEDYVA